MKTPNLELKERQMLELLTQGASTRVISKKLGYSEGTVRVYLHNLYKKIGVKNRTEALLWQLERVKEGQAHPAAHHAPAPQADESFGDVAVREGLFTTLGIMESFLGPYGRVWEVGMRLKGTMVDAETMRTREDARMLWRALLQGSFSYAKGLHDEGVAERWIESGPSEASLLVCLLLIGGYTHAADGYIAQLSKARKGARAMPGRELNLVRGLREAIYGDDPAALDGIHHIAMEKGAPAALKQLAMVALFHAYRQRKDPGRARDTANAIWSEAETSRRQLEAMGVRPLGRDASLPKPGKAPARQAAREKASIGG
jgi:DNA-binding CsgD family transcriptional regulator